VLVLLAGIVLVVVAVAALLVARANRSRHRDFAGTERTSCGDLAALAAAVRDEAGGGSFAQRAEVSGAARPGDGGPLTSPLGAQECVWFRARVTRRYRTEQRDESGRIDERETSEVVSDERSETPMAIDDGTGTVLVDPRGAQVDQPEVSLDRYEPHSGDGDETTVSAFGLSYTSRRGEATVGFQRHEEIIRPGRQLYVLGEAREVAGRVQLGKPGSGDRFVISTRSEEALSADARKIAAVATAVAGVAALAGVVLGVSL
jgi:E3 ubiquitin ligase